MSEPLEIRPVLEGLAEELGAELTVDEAIHMRNESMAYMKCERVRAIVSEFWDSVICKTKQTNKEGFENE